MKSVLLAVLVMVALVLRPFGAAAQAQTIQGIIKDSKGEALPGVTVLVKGTTNGASTGVDGRFTLQAPANSVLVISSVGFTR